MKFILLDQNYNQTSLVDISNNLEFYQNDVYLYKTFFEKSRFVNAASKTRSLVSGGGAKPYNQKGGGRARRGTNRSPLKVGGGVIFGPSPRNVSKRILKSVSIRAINSLFSNFENVYVLEEQLLESLTCSSFYQKFIKNSNNVNMLFSPSEFNYFNKLKNLPEVKFYFTTKLHFSFFNNSRSLILSYSAYQFLEPKLCL